MRALSRKGAHALLEKKSRAGTRRFVLGDKRPMGAFVSADHARGLLALDRLLIGRLILDQRRQPPVQRGLPHARLRVGGMRQEGVRRVVRERHGSRQEGGDPRPRLEQRRAPAHFCVLRLSPPRGAPPCRGCRPRVCRGPCARRQDRPQGARECRERRGTRRRAIDPRAGARLRRVQLFDCGDRENFLRVQDAHLETTGRSVGYPSRSFWRDASPRTTRSDSGPPLLSGLRRGQHRRT
jgi:hypothetical protein